MTNQVDEEKTPSGVGTESLVSRVTRMLAREAYHYCADCHAHCRQTILTVEALKETVRAHDALKTHLADMIGRFERCARFAGSEAEYVAEATKEARAALALANSQDTNTSASDGTT